MHHRILCLLWLMVLSWSSVWAQVIDTHKNTDNARCLATSKTHLAVAPSGGIRLYNCQTDTWSLITYKEGLPTHNVFDIVFDTINPDRLYALCGSWEEGYETMPHLYLASLSVPEGKATLESDVGESPLSKRARFPYLYQYRLAVADSGIFIVPASGNCLLLDKDTKTWKPVERSSIPALRPRPTYLMPTDDASLNGVTTSEKQAALFLDSTVIVVHRKTMALRTYPMPYGPNTKYERVLPKHSQPMNMVIHETALTWDVVTIFISEPPPPSQIHSYRLDLKSGKTRLTGKRSIRTAEIPKLPPMIAGDDYLTAGYLQGGTLMDILDDGQGSLWFATYHQWYNHAPGVVRYDIRTRKWSYLKP